MTAQLLFRRLYSAVSKTSRNYYQILGVDPSATPTEIREAFFRKVKEVHPDVNPASDAQTQFNQVREAYRILTEQRKDYDKKQNIYDVDDEKLRQQRLKDLEVFMYSKKRFKPQRPWSERTLHRFKDSSSSSPYATSDQPYRYRRDYVYEPPRKDSPMYKNLFGHQVPSREELMKRSQIIALLVFAPILGYFLSK